MSTPESTSPSQPDTPPDAAAIFPPETRAFLDWLFSWRGLTIRQKLLAISQKYHVFDEFGQPRFFVVRPPRIGLYFLAGLAGFVTNLLFLFLAFRLLFYESHITAAIITVFLGGYVARLIRVLLTPYRDIRVYTDETQSFQIMLISQDNKFGLHHWYTIHDPAGQPVARAKRNLVFSIWRRQWVAETLDGRPILKVREDSFLLALLRRYLGPLFGLLRTNFDLLLPDGTPIGEYNRKLTLTDQYVLDLHRDPSFLVDRRVALSLAILLDTAEGR